MSRRPRRIPEACGQEFVCPEERETYLCNRAEGHTGEHGRLEMLQEHCHHPTQKNGRCAVCLTALGEQAND